MALEKVLAAEKKYKDKMAKLAKDSKDTSLGGVRRGKVRASSPQLAIRMC